MVAAWEVGMLEGVQSRWKRKIHLLCGWTRVGGKMKYLLGDLVDGGSSWRGKGFREYEGSQSCESWLGWRGRVLP